MPQDETTALSHDDFIGYTATIILGKSAKNHSAEASFIDKFNQIVSEKMDNTTGFRLRRLLVLSGSRLKTIHYISIDVKKTSSTEIFR